jgi:hypothetical protein
MGLIDLLRRLIGVASSTGSQARQLALRSAGLNLGVDEAVVFAPHGSTPTARRFVREIRSRKGVRIRIWNQPTFAKPHAK